MAQDVPNVDTVPAVVLTAPNTGVEEKVLPWRFMGDVNG